MREGGLGLSCSSAVHAGRKTGCVIPLCPPACSCLALGAALSPSLCRCSLDFHHKLLKKLNLLSGRLQASQELGFALYLLEELIPTLLYLTLQTALLQLRLESFSFFFFHFPALKIPCCPSRFSFLHLLFILFPIKLQSVLILPSCSKALHPVLAECCSEVTPWMETTFALFLQPRKGLFFSSLGQQLSHLMSF